MEPCKTTTERTNEGDLTAIYSGDNYILVRIKVTLSFYISDWVAVDIHSNSATRLCQNPSLINQHWFSLSDYSAMAEYRETCHLSLTTNWRYLGTFNAREQDSSTQRMRGLRRTGGSNIVVRRVWSNGPPGVPDKETQQQRDALHQTRRTRGVQKAFFPGALKPGIPVPWPSRGTSFFTQTQWEDERMGQASATIGQCESEKTWDTEYFSYCTESASVVTNW